MSAWTGILVAIAVGLAAAVQTAMLGAMGRDRAAAEAAWVSLFGSIVGISVVMLVRLARGEVQGMPAPLDRPWLYAATLVLALGVLVLSLRGLPWYYGVAGLGGVIYLASAAYFVPTLGVAIFFGATTAGTVLGALIVDQLGAFGAAPTAPSSARFAGLALVVIGVVVTRLGR